MDGAQVFQETALSDPTLGDSTQVAIINTADGTLVGTPITLAGRPNEGLLLSPDGTRAYQATNGELAVINTADDTFVGEYTYTGHTSGELLSPDGSRVYQSFIDTDPTTGVSTTDVAAIDLADANLAYDPVFDGAGSLHGLTADGTRAYIATENNATDTSEVSIMNTADGTIIGSPVTLDGVIRSGNFVFGTDGRLYVSGSNFNVVTGVGDTQVAEINTSDGTLVAAPITLDGGTFGGLELSPDGTRLYETTTTQTLPASAMTMTLVAVINTADGTLVARPTTLDGAGGEVLLTPDGTRAVQTTTTDLFDPDATTEVAVINAADGTVVGTPVTLAGGPEGVVELTPDGTRAVETTEGEVAVIDVADGTVVGTPITIAGSSQGRGELTPDGTRAVEISVVDDPSTFGVATTHVMVINTADGSLVADTTVNGAPLTGATLTPDGSRIFLTTLVVDPDTGAASTLVTGIDPVDGVLAGPSIALDGQPLPGGFVFSDDGTRAYQTTSVTDDTGASSTDVAVIDPGSDPL